MLYPLKFDPILKEKIWGGNKLKTILNKPTTLQENIGESWEISTVQNDVSIISNGNLKGINLVDLIKKYKEELLGKKVYKEFGDQFPLLIKFIDAKEDLSVQLHPNDRLAKERHNSFGKTEMWYVVQSDKDSELIIGFNKSTSKEEYEKYLKSKKITELLNFEKISKGDSYFINTGKIHAIGGGALIAEIQQTSDITYRVYDWDRKDNNGNYRELHTDLALEAIDYEVKNDFRLVYDRKKNVNNELVNCNYFTTNYLKVEGHFNRICNTIDSFKIYICIEGSGSVATANNSESIYKGQTILIPAVIDEIKIIGTDLELLEVYIN